MVYRNAMTDFRDYLLENMIPPDLPQESMGVDDEKYTADDWTIDVCNALITGNWHRGSTKHGMRIKLKVLENLKKVKDDSNILCVGEVGRGLEIAIANTIKNWDKIICYDHNSIYEDYIWRYFKNTNFKFYDIGTRVFMENVNDYIEGKPILIISHTMYRDYDKLKESFVHVIHDGELLW